MRPAGPDPRWARTGWAASTRQLCRWEPGTYSSSPAPGTVMSRPVTELAAEFFPGVAWRRGVGPHETLLDSEKARRVLGYEPRSSRRSEAAAGDRDT